MKAISCSVAPLVPRAAFWSHGQSQAESPPTAASASGGATWARNVNLSHSARLPKFGRPWCPVLVVCETGGRRSNE